MPAHPAPPPPLSLLAPQLQTYELPWPFTTREYLNQCNDVTLSGGGYRSHCAPIDAPHAGAPARADRLRGRTDTLWQFTPSASAPSTRADVYFRGYVDPGGSLPKWLVHEIGKHGSVNIVVALIKLAETGPQPPSALDAPPPPF